jgi:hypothetical protein
MLRLFLFFCFGIGDLILDMIGLFTAIFLKEVEKCVEWAVFTIVYLLLKIGIVVVCMSLSIKKEFTQFCKKGLIFLSYAMIIGLLLLSILICIGLCVGINSESEDEIDQYVINLVIKDIVIWFLFQYIFSALYFLYFKCIISRKHVAISYINARNFQDIAIAPAPNKT